MTIMNQIIIIIIIITPDVHDCVVCLFQFNDTPGINLVNSVL